MGIETTQVEATRLVGLAHRGPYHRIGATWERFMGWMRAHPALFAPGARFVSVYHDDAGRVDEEDLRSHAAVTVEGDVEVPDETVDLIEVPAGRYAVWHHRGAYEGLGTAWRDFAQAVHGEPGLTPAPNTPCFEVYLDDPQQVSADRLRTDLYLPLLGEP